METFFQAEDAVVQARSAYVLATVTLYQALGGGWMQDVETAETRGPDAGKT
jgi:outer membrane protein TolC